MAIENRYDLFIVGNGFDLACDYHTTYQDYLYSGESNNSILFNCFNNSTMLGFIKNNDWNGFEKMLCQYLCFIKYLFISKEVRREFKDDAYNEYVFTIGYPIVNEVDNFCSFLSLAVTFNRILTLKDSSGRTIRNYNIFDGEANNEEFYPAKLIYYDSFTKIDAKDEIVEKRILNKINDELEKLEEGIKEFIKKETEKNYNPTNFLKRLIDNYSICSLLSFNYSYCADSILKVDSKDVLHIHGEVDKKIVLGIEENMISNQNISIDSSYGIFYKRLRRIIKDCSSTFIKKIKPHLKSDSIIGIYGHSLDLSDRSILKMIFEMKLQRYDIYCFENVNDYKLRLHQLIGIDLFEELSFDGKLNFIEINDKE